MEYMILFIIFVFGLLIGSFLNVVILRLDTGLGFGGRSKCFSCGKTLSWYELIPLFSFLLQKGKCKTCKKNISWQYPIVEFLTGFLFLSLYIKVGLSIFLPILFVLASSLIVISIFDIRHLQIPNIPLVVFYLSGLAFVILSGSQSLILHLTQGAVVASPLLFLWFISKGRWLGFGDVLLALGVGWWLGLSAGFAAIMLSVWIGAVFGIILMILKRKILLKTAIPFGPFIALGALASFLYTIDMATLMKFFLWI